MADLTKADAAALERLFVAEIQHAMTGAPIIRHLGKRIAGRLLKRGLIYEAVTTLGGRDQLAVEIRGYLLTPAGHYAYCQWADENVSEEELDEQGG